MLAWLGSDVMGPSTVDMSTHTLTGYSWGAILAQVVFLDTRLPTSVSACYFQWKVPMDGVIEQSCGCPGTRVVCRIRGAVAGGVQLGVRRWDLQGAVAGGVAAELGHCRSETQAVFVVLGYSWCLSGRKNTSPDSYPIHTPIHTLLLPFAAKSLLRSGQY